ncbi:hypothetical protein Tco_1079308 [Tanacetum coccineum]|uniref:Uncharacterized protein n=1 Tax=Tanacetum coccineum TaxID=301880 RepID=A0ABQ5HRS2_9ASTR
MLVSLILDCSDARKEIRSIGSRELRPDENEGPWHLYNVNASHRHESLCAPDGNLVPGEAAVEMTYLHRCAVCDQDTSVGGGSGWGLISDAAMESLVHRIVTVVRSDWEWPISNVNRGGAKRTYLSMMSAVLLVEILVAKPILSCSDEI